MVGDYIDYDEGYRNREKWQCPNRDCAERFEDMPEVYVCEYDCDVDTCPCCESVCFSCGKHLCADHFAFADCGDGGIKKYCQSCLEDFAENVAESEAYEMVLK